ncbi:MAG: VgrG-related protein [Anaerolineae bacterium]|nr:VgrG-related protein [Anaerolineae bacterium]
MLVNGKQLSDEMAQVIAVVTVDTSLHLPAMFELHVADTLENTSFRWIDGDEFKVGTRVKILACARDAQGLTPRSQAKPLIEGTITALECEFDAGGHATLIVRGYDDSHRLHIGRKTATYLKMTDSAIVQKVAQDAGLKVKVTGTTNQHDYVLQNNQTDMSFLRTRAWRVGFELCVDEAGTLHFRKANQKQHDGPTLEWGKELFSFRPHLSAMQQTQRVIVRAWDTQSKTLVKGQADRASEARQAGVQPEFAAAKAKAEMVVSEIPGLNGGSATTLAESIAHEIQTEFVKAEGVCMGQPSVRAGNMITLKGLGTKFGGQYLITAATHRYATDSGYTVSFSVSGRHPDTLAHLLGSEPSHDPASGRVQGMAIGLVTNVNDPNGLGRVKVKFPWLGDQVESTWCRMAAPMAGSGRGFYFLPEVNDEVLVAFEHGDPNVPFVVGTLWNTSDKPPKKNSEVFSGGKVNERILRSRSGHEIVFGDKEGAETVTIVDKNKNSIVIDSAKDTLTITVKGDCNVKANGKCVVQASQDIQLASSGADVSIECVNFNVKAKANAKIESQAQLDLESAMVNVTSKGPLAVEGKPVQINKTALVVLP